MSIPSVLLHNGAEMPMVGLGTWRSPPEVVTRVIKDALELGYRHIDCALIYANEREVGAALEQQLQQGVVKREELFVTSKLWNTYHHPDMVLDGCQTTLKDLRLAYLDLYLIHWPMAFKDGKEVYPKDESGHFLFSDVDYVDTWRAMEKLVDLGLCRAIGLSNFNTVQIERILDVARIRPAVLQAESHPYLTQQRLMQYCKEKRIVFTAYSPLGSPHTPYQKCGDYPVMENPKILSIASKLGRTTAEVLIRYQTQRGNVVIPRSITKSHMDTNLHAFDFELSTEQLAALNELDINGRFMSMPAAAGHPHHPFEHEVC